MKKFTLLPFVVFGIITVQAQLYEQTFTTDMATVTNGASTDPNYVSATPNNTQLTYLGAPTSGTVAVSGGALRTTTSSTGSRWGAVRNVDFAPVPTAVMVSMDATIVVGSSGTSAPKFVFYFGSGLTNNTTMDANTAIHSGFGIRYQNSAYYHVSTLGNTVVTTQYPESVSRTFTFVTNNSGGPLTYTAPDLSTESIADDKWDLWVGNVKVFDEQTATTNSQSLSNFKFGDINGSNGRADFNIDNITITDINPVVPVKFGSFKASLQNGKTEINWTTLTEGNLTNFEVERSANGTSFHTIASVIASNNMNGSTYAYADVAPESAVNFYRIKSIEKDGKASYTSVLKVAASKKAEMNVSPNPIVQNSINLQLNQLPKGGYTMQLFSTAGVSVVTQKIKVDESASTQTIQLPQTLPAGSYYLIISNGEETFKKQVLVY